jgi:hypothetical protein
LSFNPNAAWTTERAKRQQEPCYFIRFPDGGTVVRPISGTTFSTHAAWTSPAFAYDGNDGSEAYGRATRNLQTGVQGYASLVLSFAPGTADQARVSALVRTGRASTSQFVEVYYSTNSGATWTLLQRVTNSATHVLVQSAIMHGVDLGALRIRLTAWTTQPTLTPGLGAGYASEAWVDDLSTIVDYATGPVLAPTFEKRTLLAEIEHEAGTTDLLEGQLEVGSLRVTLADKDGSIARLLGFEAPDPQWTQIADRRIDLYAGYRSLPEAEYARVFRGRIAEVQLGDSEADVVILAEDVKAGLRQTIMQNATEPRDEARPETANLPGPIVIKGNPIDVLGAILTGVFSPTDPDFPVTVTGPTPTGCGLSRTEDVSVDQLKAVRETWFSSYVIGFEFRDTIEAAAFLADEVFRLFGPAGIDGHGRLTMFPWEPPTLGDVPMTITEDDILAVVAWRLRTDLHYNAVRVRFNFDASTNDYDNRNPYQPQDALVEDAPDIAAVGVRKELTLESKGMHATLDGYKVALIRAGNLLRLTRRPPVELTVRLPFTRREIEVGDVIKVTCSTVPDVRSGLRGVTDRVMRATAIAPSLADGTLEVTLMEFGYRRHGLIGPTSMEAREYDAWTQTEKDRYVAVAASDPAFLVM